ncbi:uracil-DNA glycosylase [Flavobacteriaceae bacterium]|jgi:uracil-DNA glycosylase|nr:uracil-DNA glycosylase [Flavobacteriaceae bacterium]
MITNIHNSWEHQFRKEFNKPYFKKLNDFVINEYENYPCYPLEKNIFAAFNNCHFNNVKVVILGQDPYHGHGQANGLCFSVNKQQKQPPSLTNILKEIKNDIGMASASNGDLESWAKQGVLLLNTTLTVREHEAGSHQKQGWEIFTDFVIKTLSDSVSPTVFLLWGGMAKKKTNLIDNKTNHILSCGHPSPLSANRGYWFGNKHFSKTNFLLQQEGRLPISW